jgi:hypothetical protein
MVRGGNAFLDIFPFSLYSLLKSTMATFADDTAVMAAGETVENSTRKLQSSVDKIAIWTRK